MKKIMLTITSILLLFAFSACTEETTTVKTTQTTVTTITTTTESTTLTSGQLAVPENIEIINNIISFDTVENATEYLLTVYDESEVLIGEYTVTDGMDLDALFEPGHYNYQLKAKAEGFIDSNNTEMKLLYIVDTTKLSLVGGADMNNSEYLRWMGRTYYNQEEASKYFFFTASGFELAFYGTEIGITIKANKTAIIGKQPYVVLFLDGDENPNNGLTFVLDAEEKTIGIDNLEYGYHTIKLVKRSEASDSNTALLGVQTDGYFTNPPEEKSFKIQYIAASSSAGYGNLGSLGELKTTANSDGLRAYAYLTSYLLDAETSIFSASGWGVSRGYNTGGAISSEQNIPYAFINVAIDDENMVFPGTYNFNEYIPDVIVVNLGTNDFNSANYSSLTSTEQEALEDRFITDYSDFLVFLNYLYPDAVIIVAYGLMNETPLIEGPTSEVVANANYQIGETKVYSFIMEGAGTNDNDFGCDSHPNVATSMNVAEDLAELIHSLTGKVIERDMIENTTE